jgi:hypothetical protein
MNRHRDALIRYCNKYNINYTDDLWNTYTNWYSDPANADLVFITHSGSFTTATGSTPSKPLVVGPRYPEMPSVVVRRFFSDNRSQFTILEAPPLS